MGVVPRRGLAAGLILGLPVNAFLVSLDEGTVLDAWHQAPVWLAASKAVGALPLAGTTWLAFRRLPIKT